MKFYLETFGCQMNEYDSERLVGFLQNKGWERIDTYRNADVVILNTCSIREKATHKIYSEIGRINIEKRKLKNLGKYMAIVVIGCVPEVEKEKMFVKAPAIDILLSPQSHLKLYDYVEKVFSNIIIKKGKTIPKKTHFLDISLDAQSKFDFLSSNRDNFNGVSNLSIIANEFSSLYLHIIKLAI